MPGAAFNLPGLKPWHEDAASKYADQLKRDGRWISSREAAALIGKGKTVAAEFMAWLRERAGDAPETTETLSISDKAKTWVDERSGMIFTELGPDYGIIAFTQGEFRSIRRDYSKHYGGGAVSQTEIALRYRFSSAHAFSVFREIHQLRQNSYPFTDTELEEEGEDALADKAIESRRQAAFLKLQEKERAAEKRDAEKWRTLEVNMQAVVASVEPQAPLPLAAPLPAAQEPYALMISLTDLHLGMLAHSPTGDVLWNRKIAKGSALGAVDDLLARAVRLGAPDEIVLLICSDGVHVDGPALTTTAGTRQGEQSEGTYRQMVEDYLDLVRRAVTACYSAAPIRLVVVEGNHDQVTSMMVGLMLEQIYRDDARVTVERQRAQGLILVTYGANTLSFMHGDYLPRGGAAAGKLWPAITALARAQGMVIQPNILSFGGHLHHENTTDFGGIVHHTLMALCPSDEWHRRALWNGAVKGAQGFLIRRSGGKDSVLYHQPELLAS